MKSKLLLLLLLLTGANSFAQYTSIPDTNFEAKLISMGIDDAADGKVLTSKINTLQSLEIYSSNISDLTGIQNFTSLTTLRLDYNKLTSLDVSQNTALTMLTVNSNSLTSLDITKNTALLNLSFSNNKISTVDVSKNISLKNLQADQNQLTSLDVSKNTALTLFTCRQNKITSLDISKNTVLTYFQCGYNELTALNIKNGKNTAFLALDFAYNKNLSCIAVDDVAYANTKFINQAEVIPYFSPYDCSTVTLIPNSSFEDKLIALAIDTDGKNGVTLNSSIKTVITLDVSNNSLKDLKGIEGFIALTTLNCSNNLLSSIDLSKNKALTTLNCSNNPALTCIQVTDVAYATNNWKTTKDANANFSLDCRPYTLIPDANFEAILIIAKYDDVADGKVLTSKINTLTNLSIQNKSIADLTGIQDFVKLKSLNCNGNKLTSLDISKNTELITLTCSTNNLSNLDVSKNTALTTLDCSVNNLSNLNLKNGKNTLLKTLNLSKNYSLSCIMVDDIAYANTNWADKKNANALYTSYECSTVTQIPDTQFENKLIALGIDIDGKNGAILNSSITGLKTLDISNSSITDLTGIQLFKTLTSLNVSNNLLKSIDLSQNSNLKTLNCSSNASLTCIQVADIAYATNNWITTKDALANFNLDCRPYTLIPDPIFEAKLISLKFDDTADGKVLTSKINNITDLNLYGSYINDLTGIQDFKALSKLDCSYNNLSSLDLSKNKNLTILICNSNKLSSLDLSENTALFTLSFNMNKIKSIDISKNTLLTNIEGYRNQLSNLDVSKNTALAYLNCYDNALTSLDVSQNTALTYLNCTANQLIKANLKNGKNTLLTLDFTFNENLSCLIVDDVAYANSKWTANQTVFPLISPYDCSVVTSIPNTLFEDKLIALGIDTDGKNGIVLNSSIEKITALDISNSSLTDLTGLTGFTALKTLNVSGNLIKSIDLSQNKALTILDCSNNTALTCIQVADIAYATSNWTVKKDVQANFNLDCRAYTLIPDAKFEAELILLKIDDITDGKVLTSKINKLKSLYVSSGSISDLTGIQDFTALTLLDCYGNNLTSLDLSKNTALTSLRCSWNKLTNLSISKNIALTSIDCSVNQLTSLDLSLNTALTSLNFANNKVTSLDISKNTVLSSLSCSSNQLKTLDLSKNIALRTLYANANKLSSLNLKNGKNTQLTALDLTDNPGLYCISVDDTAYANTNWADKKEANAYYTADDCSATTAIPNGQFEDKLIALGIDTDGKNGYVLTASIKTLTVLDISNSSLTDVRGIEGFAALKTLNVTNNLLNFLDLSKNSALTTLNCSKNTSLTCIMVADVAAAKKWTTIKDINADFNLDCRKYTAIPDAKFEAKLISLGIDDTANGKVLTSNISILKNLYVDNSSITDLTGIQDFTSLINLSCSSNQLTSLDVSKNTLLENLSAGSNELTKLDVNTALKDLSCGFNQITALDLSKNTQLKSLYCYVNKLTSLNLKNGKNTLLTSAMFHNNPDLSCIQVDDVAYANTKWTKDASAFYSTYDCATITVIPDPLFEDKLIALGIDTDGKNGIVFNSSIQTLTTLNVSNSSITNLKGIQGFAALTNLECGTNKLKSLDLSKNKALTAVACNENQLTSLDISENTALTKLNVSSNQLTSLNVSKNVALTSLVSDSNKLSYLELSKNIALSHLSYKNNSINSLDLSLYTNLTVLNCSGNSITSLDLEKNTKLETLSCSNNKLTALNISNNTALKVLDFSGNQLKSSDLSKHKVLTQLLCNSNQLTTLDISKNIALTDLNCSENQLTALNLKNGNNTKFNSAAIHFENNPNLTCIRVDNKTYSDTNWASVKDATANYDTACGLNLPSNNFTVLTKGESCPGENNGEITITATQVFAYSASVNGQPKMFTDNALNLSGLTPGNYTVSITIPGEVFEQNFNITIAKAAAITGKSSISSKKVNVEITDGTAPYTIFVDGIEQFQTNTSNFSITAEGGGVLEVKTAKACEGIYTEDITGLDLVVSAFPNPTSGSFEIELPVTDKEITIEINSLDGRLISSKKYSLANGTVQLSLENEPNGVYITKIHLGTIKTIKIIKK